MHKLRGPSSGSGCESPWPWPTVLLGFLAGEMWRGGEAKGGGVMDVAGSRASPGATRRLGRRQAGRLVLAGVGMPSTEVLVDAAGRRQRGAAGWARLVGRGR